MKIIDRKTGKRVGAKASEEEKKHAKKLKEEDPILKNVESEVDLEDASAMDPPDAYSKKHTIGSDYDAYHPFIKGLMDEHKELTNIIDQFDKAMVAFKESGFVFSKEISDTFNKFFTYFDNEIVPHNEKEERHFFRILHERLVESGEHSTGENPTTAVQLMEDDHNKFIQLAALSFNLLGLGTRLPDITSRAITFDLAYNNGRELAELLKLHIYREDETLFPLAHKLLKKKDYKDLK